MSQWTSFCLWIFSGVEGRWEGSILIYLMYICKLRLHQFSLGKELVRPPISGKYLYFQSDDQTEGRRRNLRGIWTMSDFHSNADDKQFCFRFTYMIFASGWFIFKPVQTSWRTLTIANTFSFVVVVWNSKTNSVTTSNSFAPPSTPITGVNYLQSHDFYTRRWNMLMS